MKKFLLLFSLLLPMALWAQQINVNPETLPDFSYIENHGPSEEDTLIVLASELFGMLGTTNSLTITSSEFFEISTVSGENFGNTIILPIDETGALDTIIYVRMKRGLNVGPYQGIILLSAMSTAKAVCCSGTVTRHTLPNPTFNLASGTYSGTQEINITCDTVGTCIKYRTSPTEIWQNFTPPFLVDRDMTIWAKATKEGYNDSEEVSAEYAIEYTITATANSEEFGQVVGGGTYHYGDTATLSALPNVGYVFSSWSNGETDNPLEISVAGHESYEASFEVITYDIAVLADPENGGEVNGSGIYSFFSNCTVTATANDGFAFVNWTVDDEEISTEPVYTFHSWTDRTLVAHFRALGMPVIMGEITAPEPICAGNSLQLTPPEEVNNAIEEEWQLSSDTTFGMFSVYTDQILDESYNGWQLRYMASNEAGVVYSEPLTLTVYPAVDENDVEPIVKKNCGTTDVRMLVYPRSGYQYQWYKDGQAIIGATGQYYYPKEGMTNGTYYVELGMDRDESGNLLCPMASPNVEVVVTNALSQGKAYPNPCPTIETLYIIREKEGDAQLRLYSVDGKLIHSQTITQGQNAIGVNLPQGIYVSYIIDGQGETQMERIIVQ